MMVKRGQAAMEFLMTYGWAILVVLIAIGALAYFGVLNPSRFLPESCTIGPGFSCDDFKIQTTGAGRVIIRNGMGSDLSNVSITLQPDGGGVATGTLDTTGVNDCTTTAIGNQVDDAAACGVSFTGLTPVGGLSSKFKGTLTITYIESGSGISHSKAGSLVTKIEA